MEFKYHNIDIKMSPGDKISIDVGMFHKCDLFVTGEGKLRVYYDDGNVLEF